MITETEKPRRFTCDKCKEKVTQWGRDRPVWSGEADFRGASSAGVTMCECPNADCPHVAQRAD